MFTVSRNGDLFGADNGPDRDMSDELNWLREGNHYGFPWRMGGADNPQQFPEYDPQQDLLLNPVNNTVGLYHNDPGFPPPSTPFTDPVINLGPDADRFRDPQTGEVRDSSDSGLTLSTFTAHRSSLGLVFDTERVLRGQLRGDGFMLSWTAGSPDGSGPGPFMDPSQDLVHLDLKKRKDHYEARVHRIVGGFQRPIDAEIVARSIYVLEFGFPSEFDSGGLWVVSLSRCRQIRNR